MNDIKKILERENVNVIDVREAFEYDMGHYPQAINVPLSQFTLYIDQLKRLDTPLVLYCRSGNRSAQACAILKQSGLEEVYNGGGLEEMMAVV